MVLPKLNDCGGDIAKGKNWFVEYQYRDPKRDVMRRFRVYEKLNGIENVPTVDVHSCTIA